MMMLTKEQEKALQTLPFWELKTLYEMMNNATEAYQMGSLETTRRLITLSQQITGPYQDNLFLIVRNQVGLVWVERTPGLHAERMKQFDADAWERSKRDHNDLRPL